MAGNLFNCIYVSVILLGTWYALRLQRQCTAGIQSYPEPAGGFMEGVF